MSGLWRKYFDEMGTLSIFTHFLPITMSMEATATFSNPNNSSEVSWMEGIPPNASVMEAYSDELTKLVEIHAMSPDSL